MIQIGDTVSWESATGETKHGKVIEVYKNNKGEPMLRVVAKIPTRVAEAKVTKVENVK